MHALYAPCTMYTHMTRCKQHKQEREAHRRTRETLKATEEEYKKLKDSKCVDCVVEKLWEYT